MADAGPLDEDDWQALLDRARRHPDPVERMKSLRLVIGASRFTRGELDRRMPALAALETAATGDLNEVIRETARHALADSARQEAFEAWLRVARPETGEHFDESLRMAERVSAPEYASSISGVEDRLEVHAQRAIRLVELLEAGCDRQLVADQVLRGKRALLRLAERALLQTRDPGTERRARMLVEMLRSGC